MKELSEETGTQLAVIYARVSSRKQVKEGHGLSSQETQCREYAGYHGLNVVATFTDDITGKVAVRRGMTAMLDFLRKHRRDKPVVIIDDISRLGRARAAYWELRGAIDAMGATLASPNATFGDDPESDFREGISVEFSQLERRNNQKRTINRMRARVMNGYWVTRAPIGYRYERVAGHGKLLVRDEPYASIIAEALEGFASGRLETLVEVKRFLEAQALWPKNKRGEVHQERVHELFSRPVYAGHITIEQWGLNLVPAKHEPLISLETWMKVQERRNGNAKAPARKDLREDFPLRGFVLCADCGKPFTSCWSKGRSAIYPYYLCDTRGCPSYRKSVRGERLEGDFETLLSELSPTEGLLNFVSQMFRDLWETRADRAARDATALRTQLGAVDRKIDQLLDRIIDAHDDSVASAYERKLKELQAHKALLTEKLADGPKPQRSFGETYRTVFDFLANPLKLWHSPRLEDRRAVLKLVFADRLPYARGEGYQTAKLSAPFKVLGDTAMTKKALVPHAGLEPATPSLRMTCSTN